MALDILLSQSSCNSFQVYQKINIALGSTPRMALKEVHIVKNSLLLLELTILLSVLFFLNSFTITEEK